MTRRDFSGIMLSFVIKDDKNTSRIVKEIEEANKEQDKVYKLLLQRSKFISPRGDAVACGWLRKMSALGHRVSDGFQELAEELCP